MRFLSTTIGPIGTAAGFEDNDGNLVVDNGAGSTDWNSFSPTWTGTAPYQTGTASANGFTFIGITDAAAVTSDTGFSGGIKQNDACAATSPSKAPNKDDLARAYVASKIVNGHTYLMLAWVRIPQNTQSADAHVAFEFNQSKTACANNDGLVQRTVGDLLVLYDFQSGSPTISLDTWLGSAWSAPVSLTAAGTAEAAVNTDNVSDTAAPTPETLGGLEFGEAGIDLTAAIGNLSGGGKKCEQFGNTYALSRSSGSSDTAQMEDIVGPVPFNISNCASPTLSTTPNPASGSLGTSLNDTADLPGASSPTGNVTFNLYGPSDATCSGTPLFTQSDALSGSHAATTGGPAATTAGTYHWTASYPGDDNNNAASSSCAAEAVTISKASPTIATTPNPASAAFGAALNDSAHVSGGSSPTGNVTFSLYGPADVTCSGTALYTKTVALSGSDAATTDGPATAAAGTYHWTATYNGDANNNTASSGCAAEPVTVGKASPTIGTTPNPSSAIVGAALNDTAHVSGGSSPTGNVTFSLYGPADATCSGTALYTKTVALSGSDAATTDGPASAATGTYNWTATYNGDANNNTASSTCASEAVTVTKASPGIATTPNPSSAIVGAALNDTAQVSGGSSPTGTVTFKLYGPADATCSGTALYTKTVALSAGNAATTDGPASAATGTYHWTATYNGDANNNTASSGCAAEPVTVGKASPTIATTPNPASATVGAALNDTAHVSGGTSPTGTVTFSLYGPADQTCVGTASYTKTVALSGSDAATTDGPATALAGTYHWTATYNGDANNNTASSGCAAEPVTVGKASPTIATTPNPSSAIVGSTLNDTAHVSGGVSPSGDVTFSLYGPADATCSGTALYTKTVLLLSGNAATTDGPASAATGTYHWTATYNGDANNNTASSTCASEAVTVTKASPGIATTPNPSSAIVGAALNDTAQVSGGFSPTGDVTFSLYGPADATCSGAALYTKTVALSGSDAATTDGPTTTLAGTYHWTATYNGDGNNNTASSLCVSEPVTVGKASPGIATTPNPSTANVGAALNDTAHVSGGFSPTGDVTFKLYGPADATCSGAALYTKTVALSGSDAATTDGPTTTLAGTYHWTAIYNGDGNNNTASSGCAAEPVSVGKASPAIGTTPNPSSAIVGSALNDTAQVTGGSSPTGTVTFNLYGPADATCSGTALYTKTVALSAGNAATTDGPASSVTGTYHWTATYNGDTNNNTASSSCASEPVTIDKASPGIATTPNPSSAIVGAALNDTAQVSGGFVPTGTVTFNLYGPADATCSGTALYTKTVAMSAGNAATTDGPASSVAGTYHWTATYNGDGNNNTASSLCASEAVTVNRASPTIATTPNPASAIVGASLNDSAHVSGGFSPSGNVTFNLYGPADPTCTGQALYTKTVDLSGSDAATSDGPATSSVGTYHWTATYNGDGNNNTASSGCAAEPVSVGKASPAIATTPNPATGAVGDTLNDSATLSDGVNTPQGSITFKLYGPNNATCNVEGAAPVYTDTESVDGNGNYPTSPGFATKLAGTYHWTARYSGDDSNNPAMSTCESEAVTVNPVSPTIATKLSADEVVVGTSVHDSATLTGATSDAGGTATYSYYTDNKCTAGAKPGGTVAVSGGKVADSNAVALNTAGDFYWQVVYNGDANNNPATSPCNPEDNEHLLVDKPAISITKNPKSQAIDSGGTATFTITVTNTGTTTLTGVAVTDAQAPGCAKAIGTLTAGQSSSYSCSLAGVTTPFTNSATATGHPPLGPDVTATDTAGVTVNAVPPPPPPPPPAPKIDLSITKTGSPNPATVGNQITWTEVVTNAGPSPATGVKVADAIPSGTTFVSVSTSVGTCTGGALVSCTLGNMAVGATATITIVTTANVTGTIPNTATVVGNEAETNLANNTASASVVVNGKFVPPAVFCTAVGVAPKTLFVGRKVTLTIRVSQHGKAVKGIRVKIKGSTLNITTGPSNAKGMVTVKVNPKKAGIVTIVPVSHKGCTNPRIGVTGVFTPPVTG